MFRIIGLILFDQHADTLAMTRKIAGTSATAALMNTNMNEIEAVVNGHIDSNNLEADGVNAASLNVDVVRPDYGLAQHTDGSLMVDPSDTNPGIEQGDGGIRVKVDNSSIERAAGGIQVKAGGITLAMLAIAVLQAIFPVGSVYSNRTVSTNPATLLGFGTWVAIGGFITGIDGSPEFQTPGQTGGAKTHTQTLAELVPHTHTEVFYQTGGGSGNGPANGQSASATNGAETQSAGGGTAFSILPPYTAVYSWYRSA